MNDNMDREAMTLMGALALAFFIYAMLAVLR